MLLQSINTNFLVTLVGVLVLIIGIILIIYGFTTWVKKGTKITARLKQYVAREEEPAKPVRRLLLREASGSLFSRTIGNWIKSFLGFLGRFTPQKLTDQLEHKLEIAGFPMGMHSGEFDAFRFLMLVLGIVVAFLINKDFKNLVFTNVFIGILAIFLFYLIPSYWLNAKVKARQSEIQRGLPDALDMLSVCAAAGLGFDQSLQKISDYWETDLGREFKRTIHEMEMGVSRSVALTNMSNRLDVDELTSFITIIVQAEAMGMSYADVLHSQALQMRVMRQYRAREMANKLPAKMIIPLAIFIFPAILIVILGPVLPKLLSIF